MKAPTHYIEMVKKSPTKKNMFTGRVSFSPEEFEILKTKVGNIVVKVIFKDKRESSYILESWMIASAETYYDQHTQYPYVVMYFSRHQFQKHKMRDRHFKEIDDKKRAEWKAQGKII